MRGLGHIGFGEYKKKAFSNQKGRFKSEFFANFVNFSTFLSQYSQNILHFLKRCDNIENIECLDAPLIPALDTFKGIPL